MHCIALYPPLQERLHLENMAKKLVLLNKNKAGFGLSKEAHKLFLKKATYTFFTYQDNFRQHIFLKCPPSIFERDCARAHEQGAVEAENVRRSFIHRVSDIPRDHPALLAVFDELGLEGMNDRFSDLQFVEVDDTADWKIKIVDGKEYLTININHMNSYAEQGTST